MNKLDFYIVDKKYVDYLKNKETADRGFTRVPNVIYGPDSKKKFVCGVVLNINGFDYYVPVTSFKVQKPDNFLIKDNNGNILSSLRFNYMFPVLEKDVKVLSIKNEPDQKYKILLSKELAYCRSNQQDIERLAKRTYKRVIQGKNIGLVVNSCAFQLLEKYCNEYINKED